ncbi:MAG: type III-B CRISPR module RAMP protein Cmr4 [Candidatus Brocadia sp.]|jgi:CRISPR-associated protein Cmr4
MFKKALPFFMIVETPLHAGSGSDLGIVDLPIQRERHTGFPKVESSGLKGSIREVFEDLSEIKINNHIVNNDKKKVAMSLAFGPEEGDTHSGALGFTDARLLLFPVKSMKGVFAWITCPHVLEKLKKEMELAEISNMPALPNKNTVPHNCSLIISDSNIVLEEYTFSVSKETDANENCSTFAEWLANNIFPIAKDGKGPCAYWREKMKKDLVVLTDDDFRDFVNLSTEVVARTKINNETGTVQQGALFYEEYLPQESVLYSLALASPIFKEKDDEKGIFKQNGKNEEDLVLEFFKAGLPEVIQIGGNATIGKGIVRTRVLDVENGKNR